jgi:hypothetical protein
MNSSIGRLIGLKRKSGIEIFIEWLIGFALTTLGDGWGLMLAVGIVHNAWIHQFPTIGYWWSVLLVLLLRGTFSRLPKVEPYRDKP